MSFLSHAMEEGIEYKRVKTTIEFINQDGSRHLLFKDFGLEESPYLFDTLLNAFDLDYNKFNKKLEG